MDNTMVFLIVFWTLLAVAFAWKNYKLTVENHDLSQRVKRAEAMATYMEGAELDALNLFVELPLNGGTTMLYVDPETVVALSNSTSNDNSGTCVYTINDAEPWSVDLPSGEVARRLGITLAQEA